MKDLTDPQIEFLRDLYTQKNNKSYVEFLPREERTVRSLVNRELIEFSPMRNRALENESVHLTELGRDTIKDILQRKKEQ